MKLVLAGDVMLGRLVNRALRSRPASDPWGDTLPIFRAADWSFCNLECVISDLVPPALPRKAFHFRSDRKNVAVLSAAGIKAVALANNHSLDFGAVALLDMLQTLDRAGIGHAGAGKDLEAAMQPSRSIAAGTRVAVLACTDNEPDWAAAERTPGVWWVPADPAGVGARQLLDRVRGTAGTVDLLVVSLHWGSNWGREPEPEHRELARGLAAAGADIVFGHSCHVFRGVEVVGRSLVVYGAGDYIDDYAVDPHERNDRSFLFEVDVEGGALARLWMHPVVIGDLRVRLARADEGREMLERMRELSGALGCRIGVMGDAGRLELTARAE